MNHSPSVCEYHHEGRSNENVVGRSNEDERKRDYRRMRVDERRGRRESPYGGEDGGGGST